jgi:hypothetical protein
MFDAIERFAQALLVLNYDLDRLVQIEGDLRYVAGLLRGARVRGGR